MLLRVRNPILARCSCNRRVEASRELPVHSNQLNSNFSSVHHVKLHHPSLVLLNHLALPFQSRSPRPASEQLAHAPFLCCVVLTITQHFAYTVPRLSDLSISIMLHESSVVYQVIPRETVLPWTQYTSGPSFSARVGAGYCRGAQENSDM